MISVLLEVRVKHLTSDKCCPSEGFQKMADLKKVFFFFFLQRVGFKEAGIEMAKKET